ncbi:ABC transporter permease [Buchananella hordeovulneris]|nr:ABC transporter permease [Buchananella hordeovulneris]RRD51650.1 ABC transporter permease [Buchananella hordeovulneris]
MPQTTSPRVGASRLWQALRRDRWACASVLIIVLLAALALLAPFTGLDPHTYHAELLDPRGLPLGPAGGMSLQHPLGVEPGTGRDLLAITVYGARASLAIGIGSTLVAVALGALVGIAAGYFGGLTDTVLSRLIDVLLAFPSLIFMIAIAAILPPETNRPLVMILILGLFGWATIARVVRALTIRVRTATFVRTAEAMGASRPRVLATQVLPQLSATLIVFATMSVPGKIGAEAALSFLGVGLRPPTPSWGRSIKQAVDWISTDPWYLLGPGLALVSLTLAFNLLGDTLRDALDPTEVAA